MGSRRFGAVLLGAILAACGGTAFQTSGGGGIGNPGTGGDTSGVGGNTGSGGAAGTGGQASKDGGRGGGGAQTGGSTGTGGGATTDASIPDGQTGDVTVSPCIELRRLVDELLLGAKACTGQDTNECTQEVAGICCPEVVASPDSTATTQYLAELDKYIHSCSIGCTATLCPTGQGKCTAGTGGNTACVRSGVGVPQ